MARRRNGYPQILADVEAHEHSVDVEEVVGRRSLYVGEICVGATCRREHTPLIKFIIIGNIRFGHAALLLPLVNGYGAVEELHIAHHRHTHHQGDVELIGLPGQRVHGVGAGLEKRSIVEKVL